MKILPLSLLLTLLLTAGCSPSGEWSNDPKNWERAFEIETPPDGIEILNSWYMRTPHFTAEFAWFFELKLSADVKKGMLEGVGLRRLSDFTEDDLRRETYNERPPWFTLEPLSDWAVFESEFDRGFFMFVEKSGSRSFWTRYQL